MATEGQTPAIVIAVETPSVPAYEREDRMEEMRRLADTAGLSVVGEVTQVRESPDPNYFIGKGKVSEVESLRAELGAEVVLFNTGLSPVQIRNVERLVEARVVDRNQLILDIFASRARTAEGKLQVELAQLMYALPRLRGRGEVLSRLGGGIGTRGPGETRLEVDRRRIKRRISWLRREIDSLRLRRDIQRSRRRSAQCPLIALVGYTNSGKSTLLNRLTGAGVLAEDRLFATLDPTVRSVALPSGKGGLIVDTVGFIRDLPHELVAAFRATLEEVSEADVLVHVVDFSNPAFPEQMDVVLRLVESLGGAGKPAITAFNKCDLDEPPERLLQEHWPAVRLSALRGAGIQSLLERIDDALSGDIVDVTFEVPYSKQSVLPSIHNNGRVVDIKYGESAIHIRAEVPVVWAQRVGEALRLPVGGEHGRPSEDT